MEKLIVVAHTALKAIRDYIAKAEVIVEAEVKKEEAKDASASGAQAAASDNAGTPVV
jgi:hypothetical protein